jgi:hypothetical protein
VHQHWAKSLHVEPTIAAVEAGKHMLCKATGGLRRRGAFDLVWTLQQARDYVT